MKHKYSLAGQTYSNSGISYLVAVFQFRRGLSIAPSHDFSETKRSDDYISRLVVFATLLITLARLGWKEKYI
jgi:hypothetical protein